MGPGLVGNLVGLRMSGYIWARFTARLLRNQPSPVRKVWGLAVWASRMFFPDVVGWVARDGPKGEAAMKDPSPPLR